MWFKLTECRNVSLAVPVYYHLTFASWWYTDFDFEHWTGLIVGDPNLSIFPVYLASSPLTCSICTQVTSPTNVNITVLEKWSTSRLSLVSIHGRTHKFKLCKFLRYPYPVLWRLWLCWHEKGVGRYVSELKYAHFFMRLFQNCDSKTMRCRAKQRSASLHSSLHVSLSRVALSFMNHLSSSIIT